MKDYKHIEHMRNLNDSLIWERMKRCYDYGYEDGKADTPFTDTEEAEKKAYERGLDDIWEVIKKVTEDKDEGGYSIEMLQKLFGSIHVYDITHNYTPKEALAKIKAYEDKQEQFAVGDEVYSDAFDNKGIITHITADKVSCVCIICNGSTMMKVGTNGLHKTGRHFDAIPEVLKQMNREEDK